MSLLKLSALTISGITLWLAPPAILSRKVPMHGLIQGIALVSSFACCFEGRRTAIKLAKAEDFEAMQARAITNDAVDELATSIYVSEKQRRNEAEAILANQPESEQENENELNSIRKSLELLLNPGSKDSGELAVVNLSARQREQIESILQCHIRGITGKNKILKEVWGVSPGSSQGYRDAKAEYEILIPFVNSDEA